MNTGDAQMWLCAIMTVEPKPIDYGNFLNDDEIVHIMGEVCSEWLWVYLDEQYTFSVGCDKDGTHRHSFMAQPLQFLVSLPLQTELQPKQWVRDKKGREGPIISTKKIVGVLFRTPYILYTIEIIDNRDIACVYVSVEDIPPNCHRIGGEPSPHFRQLTLPSPERFVTEAMETVRMAITEEQFKLTYKNNEAAWLMPEYQRMRKNLYRVQVVTPTKHRNASGGGGCDPNHPQNTFSVKVEVIVPTSTVCQHLGSIDAGMQRTMLSAPTDPCPNPPVLGGMNPGVQVLDTRNYPWVKSP